MPGELEGELQGHRAQVTRLCASPFRAIVPRLVAAVDRRLLLSLSRARAG